ncbi:MAG: cation transporter [Nevskia sp.]|nr:cation transporter [Nevskia sp.]
MLKDLPHVVHPLGTLLIGFSFAYLPPLATALLYGDGALLAFAIALGINLLLGSLLWLMTRRARRELRARDGFLLVALAWIVFAADAAIPLMLALPQLSFTDAYFESMSGFTATGATLLTGIDQLPHAVNLWRHELCWLGGLGVIGLGMAVLPLLGIGGMQVYRAEASGPIKETRLLPRFVQTARSLWMIYIVLTIACAIALRIAGMNLFDAICHALSTLSLGGISTHDAKIGYFHSQAIEAVLMVFMLLAGINFATHFVAWRGRSLRAYLKDPEAIAFLVLVLASVFGLALYLWQTHAYHGPWPALRYAAFNVISIATDCGFYNTDYDRWPLFAGLWMLLLSCIAVSAGSTGGGIKMIRILILFRQSAREIYALLHPTAVHSLKLRGQVLPERVALSALGFIHLYTMSMVGLTFLLILSGMDFLSAFSAIVATLNNVGPGLHGVGPGSTYAGLSDFQTWVCTVSMLVGRLEFFVVLIPLTPGFWRD